MPHLRLLLSHYYTILHACLCISVCSVNGLYKHASPIKCCMTTDLITTTIKYFEGVYACCQVTAGCVTDELPYGTSMLSDDIMWLYQTNTQLAGLNSTLPVGSMNAFTTPTQECAKCKCPSIPTQTRMV